jgi:hypothetical protein
MVNEKSEMRRIIQIGNKFLSWASVQGNGILKSS